MLPNSHRHFPSSNEFFSLGSRQDRLEWHRCYTEDTTHFMSLGIERGVVGHPTALRVSEQVKLRTFNRTFDFLNSIGDPSGRRRIVICIITVEVGRAVFLKRRLITVMTFIVRPRETTLVGSSCGRVRGLKKHDLRISANVVSVVPIFDHFIFETRGTLAAAMQEKNN